MNTSVLASLLQNNIVRNNNTVYPPNSDAHPIEFSIKKGSDSSLKQIFLLPYLHPASLSSKSEH